MKKNKIFIDCGLYQGIAIEQYCFDDSWTIYAFEPSPKLNLKPILARLPKLKLIKKAVWTKNERVEFGIPEREDGAHISGMTNHPVNKLFKVPAIDFSKWLGSLGITRGDFVVCSMDIEGAEFSVLRKLIDDGTIRYINVLDVEFHHRAMTPYTPDDARALIKELDDLGIVVRVKVVLE